MSLNRSYIVIRTEWLIEWYTQDGFGGWRYSHTSSNGYREEVIWNQDDYYLYEFWKGSGDVDTSGGGGSGPYGTTYTGIATREEATVKKIEDRHDYKVINNLIDPCARNIFSQLEIEMIKKDLLQKIMKPTTKVNLTFAESILKLFNDFDKYHYSIKNEKLNESTAASTTGISTTMNDLYLKNASQLSIARTMIHEMVHAFLNVKYSDPFHSGFDFRKKMELYAAETGLNINDVESFHHNFMGQYVNAMAVSLYTWDTKYGSNGNLECEYYRAMAFGGLFI